MKISVLALTLGLTLQSIALPSALAATPTDSAELTQLTAENAALLSPPKVVSSMFGAQLFNGTMSTLGEEFNPNYQISSGDRIALKMWGAFEYAGNTVVDPQGNIFLPNIGPLKVAGMKNNQLNTLVTNKVRQVYKSNVNVYASLEAAQPVKVFVTGFVTQPGLYGGVASDSLLSYIDKAGGVDPARGSYVDITVKRGSQIRKKINLYDFLLNGSLDLIQFTDGDVIVIGPRQHTFSVAGEVFNAYDFEFEQANITVKQALEWARPKPGATHVSIIRRQGSEKRSEYYPINQAANVTLQDGDQLAVTADRYAGTIQVRIEGAHSGQHAIVLPYGATMEQVLKQINANSMSRVDALQLFRKSVQTRQKEMLNLSLDKLEQSVLSARSSTSEEANLRIKEADLITRFVQKARQIEPKGQVVLNKESVKTTLLEDGDIIRIPERTSLVMVHGEVLFPNAVSWQKGNDAKDYIKQVGGFSQNSDNSKVIIIRQNGESESAGYFTKVNAGDEIMVLPKVDSKNIEVTRGISTILYQIAIAAKVVLDI
ncbi:MAG: polysaccharide biosynthesis/export family protein [Plesiomonas sp.]|uniref:polysaccharide biosynthesis/export family protein n=1 Tax=Plesiomonas sp. TaxID=2486279 RepID=UPI003F3BBA36